MTDKTREAFEAHCSKYWGGALHEQIREAALFDTDSDSLGNVETHILYAFADIVSPLFLDDIETRTFMLLVADALK